MKSAIVIGGNGLIGRGLVRRLAEYQIPTIVLGTADKLHVELEAFNDEHIDYVKVPRKISDLEALDQLIRRQRCFTGNSIFYNLAWRGKEKLVDGDAASQLVNVETSCLLVRLARRLDSEKYVAAGSMEEVVLERYVNSEAWLMGNEKSEHGWYALAKVAARLQSSFEAYNQKIDYCYTRISIVVDKKLRTQKFIEQSLSALLTCPVLPVVKNTELCTITSSEEIANQLIAIGEKGKNKQIYTLGSNECATLIQYFRRFAESCHGFTRVMHDDTCLGNAGLLTEDDFKITDLIADTGYIPQEYPDKLFLKIIEEQ